MSLFRNMAQWVFFLALLFAPWAYGGTTTWSIRILDWLMLGVLSLWLVDLAICRRLPGWPRLLLLLVFALLVAGGWMVLNAGAILDSDFGVFVALPKLVRAAPGSVDYAVSADFMIRAGLLLGVVLFVFDLSQDNNALLRLCYAIGAVAGSFALLGLLQKATGAPMIFWQAPPEGGPVTTFFGTFFYHANAGAFLNLVLPLTAGLALRSFTAPTGPNVRATWAAVFALTLASVAANTSRVAQLTGVLILLALCWQLGPSLLRRLSRTERKMALSGGAAVLFTMLALAQAIRLNEPLTRWGQLSEHLPNDARWQAARVALSILPDAGALGFGPGSFRILFPVYNNLPEHRVPGGWRFLHDDYLQTVLEWGWVGSLLWMLLFFGGIGVAIHNLRKPEARTWSPRRRLILPLAAIALGGVAFHALVDFPLQIASIQLYAATFLGICWGSHSWKGEDKTQAAE